MHEQSEAATDTTDNGDVIAKLAVRHKALSWATKSPAILETNAGEGHLYRAVWSPACSRHLGIDKRFSRAADAVAGECWRGDNETLLKRAMAAGPWDVVDIDTYANPWPLLRKVLTMSPLRPLVVVTTCSQMRALKANNSDFAMAVARTGVLAPSLFRTGAPLYRWYEDIIRWAMAWAEEKSPLRAVQAAHARSSRVGTGTSGAVSDYYAIRYQARAA